MVTVLVALCAGAAAYLMVPAPARFARVASRPRPQIAPPIAAAVLTTLAAVLLLGFPVGLIAAVVGAPVAARMVERLETAAQRSRRERIERDLPFALDLIVAALESGQSTPAAMRIAGQSLDGPLGADFVEIAGRMELGAEPADIWVVADGTGSAGSMTGGAQATAPLGRALIRAARSGATATRVLQRAAADMRSRRRSRAQEKARSVGVKTAAPLGLCFLPAFVLIGIVPTIISAFRGLTW